MSEDAGGVVRLLRLKKFKQSQTHISENILVLSNIHHIPTNPLCYTASKTNSIGILFSIVSGAGIKRFRRERGKRFRQSNNFYQRLASFDSFKSFYEFEKHFCEEESDPSFE